MSVCVVLFFLNPDRARCECSSTGCWPTLCHVWPQQCEADCGRNAELSGDCWLLNQRGNSASSASSYTPFTVFQLLPFLASCFSPGAQGCYPSRKICCRLHLVRRYHSQPNTHCWWLCQWGGVVSCHPDCHKSRWCPRLCCQDRLWGEHKDHFTKSVYNRGYTVSPVALRSLASQIWSMLWHDEIFLFILPCLNLAVSNLTLSSFVNLFRHYRLLPAMKIW